MKVQVNKIKQLTDADAADTSLSRLLFHPKPYWVELNKYHQLEVAKETLVPMYFLHGERDYQVSMKDFNAWKTALALKKNAHFKLYPKLNHMLQEGVGKSSPDEYNKVGNVPLYVINDLAGWIIPKTVPISIPKTIPKTTPKTTPKKK